MWVMSAASSTNVPGHRARHQRAPALELMHGLEMNETHRMIEEVRGGERKQNEAGEDPHPLGTSPRSRTCMVGGRFVQQDGAG